MKQGKNQFVQFFFKIQLIFFKVKILAQLEGVAELGLKYANHKESIQNPGQNADYTMPNSKNLPPYTLRVGRFSLFKIKIEILYQLKKKKKIVLGPPTGSGIVRKKERKKIFYRLYLGGLESN